ncbi:DNA-3-methyladenine glycosylase I [Corynebacterium uropygiale]|uniref:DNA-3-methyladenine glycosylase I n=1 Tax=Corynebacterium uropygiale TaxID=1775911 RepID=A0A9X1QRP6_9CORY|nr:DNA-3-methyladenine glycosylase I [Corynebacterium uropygiale]MCF4005775.1 DNA-3-methyladenine glycosylase I [Corynebacterium uropygiale]
MTQTLQTTAQAAGTADPDVIRGEDGVLRPRWAAKDELLRAYYDEEWGFPVRDEQGIFERICLEGFQSGLSWSTILRKRPAFREVCEGFDPEKVASFGEKTIAELLADERIIRNPRKIHAMIRNARATLQLREAEGLADLVWSFEEPEPHPWRCWADIPSSTPASAALARRLKAAGFSFVGPTTMFALMQAIGIINCRVPLGGEESRREPGAGHLPL